MGIRCGELFNKTGGTIERVVHNNDFYYDDFSVCNNGKNTGGTYL